MPPQSGIVRLKSPVTGGTLPAMTVLDDTAGDLKREVAELQRLLAEHRSLAEVVAQQAASSEVLQVINSSSGELGPVFGSMLEKALSLCDASFGFLAVLNENYVHVVAERGIPAALGAYHREPYEVVPDTPMDRFMRGEQVLHIPD